MKVTLTYSPCVTIYMWFLFTALYTCILNFVVVHIRRLPLEAFRGNGVVTFVRGNAFQHPVKLSCCMVKGFKTYRQMKFSVLHYGSIGADIFAITVALCSQ